MSRPSVERPAPDPRAALRPTWWAWLAVALGAVCFLNSIANDFVYDDVVIVRDNPRVRTLGNFSAIWLSDWWQPQDRDQEVERRHRDRLYRPLTLFTVALDYAAGGLHPGGYHAVNVALHAGVCLLVWLVVQRLFGDAAVSSCAALLFAVHPVHSEAVANVVGRAEILAALFLLLGLLVLLPVGRLPSWRRVTAAATLFLAALFSKETAVCYFPVALIVLHAAGHPPESRPLRWWARNAAILLVPLAIYLPLRYVALDYHLLRDRPPHVLLNPLLWADGPHRCLHAFTVLGHYVRLLVAPGKLSCNYGLAVVDPDSGPELLTLVGVLAAAGAVVALVGYRRTAGVWRRLAVLTAVSLASYVLISNTLLLIGVSLAERLMYWPSVPLLAMAAVGVVYLWRQTAQPGRLLSNARRLLPVLGVLLLVALAVRSVVRNADWAANLTLFVRDAATYPRSAELNAAAAHDLLKDVSALDDERAIHRRLKRVDHYLEQALAIYPRFAEAMQLRGRVLAMLGEQHEAIRHFEMATGLAPLDRVSQQLLAGLRDATGEQAARLAELADQVSTRPSDAALRLAYGQQLLLRGQYHEALPELEEAVRLAPENADALRSLGEACIVMNQRERAIELLQAAGERTPDDWRIHVNLSGMLFGRDNAASLRHAQEAQRLAPASLEASLALAEALAVNDRRAEALRLYRQIGQNLEPDDPVREAVMRRIEELASGRP